MRTITGVRLRGAMRSAWQRAAIRVAIRTTIAIGVLVAVIAEVGTGPFLHGLLSVDGRAIAAALLFAAIATVAAAWRWRLIAIRLGVELRWPTAIGMYYRSQFLNMVLPGGVVGDVHRAVAHGQSVENMRQTARAVVIERTAGQVVQIAMAAVVLAWFGAEFQGFLLAAIGIGVGVIVVAVLVTVAASARGRRVLLHEVRELGAGVGSVRTGAQVVFASVIVVACHVATFTVATAAVGVSVPPLRMLALAFVVLLGSSIPLNIGGWGPREGIAGWAFALAGFGASAGVAASTLFGVLCLIAVAPGAVVAVISAARRRGRRAAAPHAIALVASEEKAL